MKKVLLKESCSEFKSNHQFNGIDLVKFICILLICTIHINPITITPLEFNIKNFFIQNGICRIAVPFYFIASGFLLFRKMESNNLDDKRIKEYCFRILRLMGTWTFLLFVGGSGQLWFFGALVLAIIIISFLIKKGISLKVIFLLSFLAFTIGIFGTSYYGFLEPLKKYSISRLIIVGYDTIFVTTRNGIFFGLIFVLIGLLFAKKQIHLNKYVAIIGLIISIFLMYIEIYFLKFHSHPKKFDMYISLLPASFFLFYIASHINLKDRPIYSELRIIGIFIFFIHLFIHYFVELFTRILYNRNIVDITNLQYIITMIITVILAIFIEKLSKKEKFSWLKYLYS